MYSDLFESIIRTSGADTNDFNSEEDNFWAPVPENLLFERVLRETLIKAYKYFGIFDRKALENPAMMPKVRSANFSRIIQVFISQKYYDCIILPCNKNGTLTTNDPDQLHKQLVETVYERKRVYATELSYLDTYEKRLDKAGLLQLSEELLDQVNKQTITSDNAMGQRTNADLKNQ